MEKLCALTPYISVSFCSRSTRPSPTFMGHNTDSKLDYKRNRGGEKVRSLEALRRLDIKSDYSGLGKGIST